MKRNVEAKEAAQQIQFQTKPKKKRVIPKRRWNLFFNLIKSYFKGYLEMEAQRIFIIYTYIQSSKNYQVGKNVEAKYFGELTL